MKLQIEKAVYGGDGLARATEDRKTANAIFVPFTLPGEVVEVQPANGSESHREAALLHILEPAKQRVEPACDHFGRCGGCQYQHAEYSAQVEMKIGILRETLERAGLSELPATIAHTGAEWEYRNRIRLRCEQVDGMPRLGYNERGSARFLPIHECPIAAPLLWQAAESLLTLGKESAGFAAWVKAAVEVEFYTNSDESKLQMTLFVRRSRSTGFAEFCSELKQRVPQLVGAGVTVLTPGDQRKGRRAARQEAGVSWGAAGLSYRVGDREYWVGRGGFFQVNRFLVDEMVRVVAGGRKGLIAWDLYAGVGLFSRALDFERVVAVEGSEVAAGELIRAMQTTGGQGVRMSTLDFLRRAVVERERPELVVMDPPRAGLGPEVCALLSRICAEEMIYVSCDPVTLARDLKMLAAAGYKLLKIHMFDLFPQTFHIEAVVVLHR